MNKIERVRASAKHMIQWVKKSHGTISNKVLVKDAEDALSLCDDLEAALEALESISKNTCCGDCQEAKKVALKALKEIDS